MTSLPWWEAVSAQGLIEIGRQQDQTLNTAMRSIDGSWALVYVSSHTHVLLRLGHMKTQNIKATWINPQDGERKDAGIHQAYKLENYRGVRTACMQTFSCPDVWEDAVLLLESVL